MPPSNISEALLDHDYTLLAIQRYSEGAREYWAATISGLRNMEANMVEPIQQFLRTEFRSYKVRFDHILIQSTELSRSHHEVLIIGDFPASH